MRPKIAKFATNDELRRYVQDRLAGAIATPGGVSVPGSRCVGEAGVTGLVRIDGGRTL